MKLLSRFKIRHVLIVVITIFTVLTLIFQSITIYHQTSTLISEKAYKESLETSRQISHRINSALNSVEQIAVSLMLSNELREFLALDNNAEYYEQIVITDKIQTVLSNIANTQDVIEDIVILTNKLDIYNYATPNCFFELERMLSSPLWHYMEKHNAGYTPTQPHPFLNYSSHKNVFTYYQKIYSNNQLVAILCININEQYLRQILADSEDSKNHFIIVDNKQNPITPYPRNNMYLSMYQEILRPQEEPIDESTYHDIYIDSQKYLHIQKSIINDWKIIYLKSYDEVTSGIDKIVQTLVIIALICFTFSFLFILYFSRAITIPIRNLISETKKVGEGNFDIVLDDSFQNEIGIINQHLNQIIQQIKALINEIQSDQIKIKESELKALQAQINPHFLYNTLDSINWMAINIGAENISNMASNLGTFFRHSLNKGHATTSLNKEFLHLRAYLSIQEYRYNYSFSYIEEIDDACMAYTTVNLILQPLIENSLLHGAKNTNGECEIIVSTYFENQDLIIHVKDDGCGCNHDLMNECLRAKLDTSKGYGVKNVDQRIKIQFGQRYGLTYLESTIGTCVEIKLPLIKYH